MNFLRRRRPPRLAQPPRLRKPPLPAWRIALRVMVWTVLALVLSARWIMPLDRSFQGRGWQARNGGGDWMQDQRGRRYGSSKRVQDPVGPVPTNLWRIRIDISAADMEVLRSSSFDWRRPTNAKRPEVRVTVREGDTVYTNVALHLKGSAGSFRPVDGTPGLTLNFSKHAKGRTFHGYSKFSLNNSVQDPSYLAEALTRELFERAGAPAPRTDHATVILNGRDLGLYVFAEGWGKPFLRRHFPDPDGALYDSGFVRDIDADLSVNSGPDKPGRRELDRLIAASNEPDPAVRWRRMGEILDVERFAGLLAMEVMTCHWDGYGLNRNNYRVFHDRSTGRLVFLPHGLDQMFGRGERMPPESSIEPYMRGMVARAFLFTVEGRKLYYDRMTQFRSEFFLEPAMTARVRELSARIRPTLAAYGPEHVRDHDDAVREMVSAIRRRVQSIDTQLAHPRDPVEFDAEGVYLPSGWESRRGSNQGRSGRITFTRAEEDGGALLRIAGDTGGANGSWRTRVRLGPGVYRFEGRARLSGVAGQGGVCLRVSGGQRRLVLTKDGPWQNLTFRFEIAEPVVETELVCEFDAGQGEAVFDESSLRLVRAPAGPVAGR